MLAHRGTWDRLEYLTKHRRRLSGAEADELVDLYQRVSTHLSMVRSSSNDSVLIGRLSTLVARGRAAVTGAHAPLSREFVRFWTVSFPVVAYRAWRWWLGSALVFLLIAALFAVWVANNPDVQAAIGTPESIRRIVDHDFESYYSDHPAGLFALQVWVNNAWIAVQCIAYAIVLGLPIPFVLYSNAANVGVMAGLMFGWFGAAALAAGQVVGSIGEVIYMAPLGMAAAVGIRISQARGAGENGRLRAIGFSAILTVVAWMAVVSLLLVLFGRTVAASLSDDPKVIALASAMFLTCAISRSGEKCSQKFVTQ